FFQQCCCDGAMADGQSRKGARASRSRVMRAGCPPSLTALRDMGGGRLARDIAIAPKSNLEAGCREITSPTGAPNLSEQKVVFHYHRFDGEYEGVSIWFWNAQPGVQGRS